MSSLLHNALEALEEIEPRKAQTIELHYFGATRDLRAGQPWLACELRRSTP